MRAELTEVEVARWWHEQSERQGLPDQLTPAELARVIALTFAGRDGAAPDREGAEADAPA